MQEPERVAALFDDAWSLYQEAINLLEAGNLRVAAEAAWGATKRASDGLILARTGREPLTSGRTSRGLRVLRRHDPAVGALRRRYTDRQAFLHGDCFYRGIITSEQRLLEVIHETTGYILEAQRLAGY